MTALSPRCSSSRARDEVVCDQCKDDRHDQRWLGLEIIRGMKQREVQYGGGTILDPRDGKIYHATMKLTPDGQTLVVRGYIGIELLGENQYWTRLPDSAYSMLDPSVNPNPAVNRAKPRDAETETPAGASLAVIGGPRAICHGAPSFTLGASVCCSRGLPISTGWNSAAAAIVVTSDSASNLPMLDVPGMARKPQAAERGRRGAGAEDHRAGEPRLQQVGLPLAPRHDVVDLERDADAEQQRQRDDVGEIQRQADQHADFQRDDAGEQQRHQRQQHVAEPAQRDPQQDRDRDQRAGAGLDEGADDRAARLEDRDRPADRGRARRAARRARNCAAPCCRWIAARRDLDTRLPVRRHPLADELRRQVVERDLCALNRSRRSSSAVRNGCTNTVSARWRTGRIGLGERRHRRRQAPRRVGARTGAVAGQPIERSRRSSPSC